jgi:hypothetical protein
MKSKGACLVLTTLKKKKNSEKGSKRRKKKKERDRAQTNKPERRKKKKKKKIRLYFLFLKLSDIKNLRVDAEAPSTLRIMNKLLPFCNPQWIFRSAHFIYLFNIRRSI